MFALMGDREKHSKHDCRQLIGVIFQFASSSFGRFVTNCCLATQDLGAGVEEPINCLIIKNCQAVQSMGRSMDWTLEDNMVNAYSSVPHS